MAATVCGGVFAGVFMDYLIVVACTLQISSQCATWCRFSHISRGLRYLLVWFLNPPTPHRVVCASSSMAARGRCCLWTRGSPPPPLPGRAHHHVLLPLVPRLVLASSSGPGLKIRSSGSFTVSHLLLIVFDITLMACEQDGEALLIDQSCECWSV